MKKILLVVLSLVIGAGSGAAVMRQVLVARIDQAEHERDEARGDLRQASDGADKKAARTAARLRDLELQNQVLEQRLRMLSEKAGPADEPTEQESLTTSSPNALSRPTSSAASSQNQNNGLKKDGALAEPNSPAAETEQRSIARERVRERLDSFLQDELQKTGDPEVQQRLAQIRDYTEQLSEMRRSMRNAPPDERAALRDRMTETVGALRDVGEAQQDYMVREVAREFDITDPDEQEAFVGAFRELQASPFFRPESLIWGANRRIFKDVLGSSR